MSEDKLGGETEDFERERRSSVNKSGKSDSSVVISNIQSGLQWLNVAKCFIDNFKKALGSYLSSHTAVSDNCV